MLRRSFLALLGLLPLGFLPKHLSLPGPKRGYRKYYVEAIPTKPMQLELTPDGKRVYSEFQDGQWVITHIEC
jgi:hypothetical protein